MKTLLKIIIISLLISSCSSSKNYTYFDENNFEISSREYTRGILTGKLLSIQLDSTKLKLTTREKHGTLTNLSKFVELLEVGLDTKIDSTKPIVIIFYPGEDKFNRALNENIDNMSKWYYQLENGLQQVAKIKPLYIYKDSKGLENYEGLLDWKQDPNQFIEHLFFKHHYPCHSFVVISSKGDYISYFGEFPKEFVWEAAQILK
ncbi:hypothetical protein [Pontimicrobium sp. SW4]|uniref:Lipoprotein n=1 Tax=Pontimicrobium sp. SW4 TaxID=3153519 RepID=A0AAU7BQU8_9FLAO